MKWMLSSFLTLSSCWFTITSAPSTTRTGVSCVRLVPILPPALYSINAPSVLSHSNLFTLKCNCAEPSLARPLSLLHHPIATSELSPSFSRLLPWKKTLSQMLLENEEQHNSIWPLPRWHLYISVNKVTQTLFYPNIVDQIDLFHLHFYQQC